MGRFLIEDGSCGLRSPHLLCASCGGCNIHHERVDVFEREEDAFDGLHTSVSRTGTKIDRDMRGNPSRRRHGLTVYFSCEECGFTTRLVIFQHKGATIIDSSVVEVIEL